MKSYMVKAVITAMILCTLSSLLAGCFFKNKVVDGPGMVNYNGVMLDVLGGDWLCNDDSNYVLTFGDDYTLNLSYSNVLLLDKAALTLYASNMDTNEYREFDIKPNVFTDEAGSSVEITKACHENGLVTLELTSSDGTKSTLTFFHMPELQDGNGMSYSGGILDEAITGCWLSTDERFVLDFEGKYADFTVDGKQLVSKSDGTFVDHSFSSDDGLNERCELFPFADSLNNSDDPPFTISEMWYQAEHIYINVVWPDGKTEEIVLNKTNEAMPDGDK